MVRPKAIDVFCGCGGTTQGLKDAGFRVIAGIEIDPLSVETYQKNHFGVKVWAKDIRKLSVNAVMVHHKLAPGELDLLAGCPPCQAYSTMRRLNGRKRVRDKKSKDLVFELLRFVRKLKPKVVMIENVPFLMADSRFKAVQKKLNSLGYKGKPAIFNAADYGVPQRRRRMIFIASRVGPLFHAEPLKVDNRLSVRDTIGHLPAPGKSGDALHDLPENRSEKVRNLIAMIPKNGGSRTALGKRRQLKCHKKCDGFKDIYGRMSWDDLAPTITSGCVNPSKGRFIHPEQDRAITLREAALLQGFPPSYFFSLDKGKSSAALMIGNAFPPRFVKAHAMEITRLLQRSIRGKGK